MIPEKGNRNRNIYSLTNYCISYLIVERCSHLRTLLKFTKSALSGKRSEKTGKHWIKSGNRKILRRLIFFLYPRLCLVQNCGMALLSNRPQWRAILLQIYQMTNLWWNISYSLKCFFPKGFKIRMSLKMFW